MLQGLFYKSRASGRASARGQVEESAMVMVRATEVWRRELSTIHYHLAVGAETCT